MTRNGNSPLFHRMLELAMAASLSDRHPAIIFQYTYDFPNGHALPQLMPEVDANQA